MIKPVGFGSAVFGDVVVSNRNREIKPASVGFAETVSPFARIWNKDNRSAVAGWDSLNIGLPEIQLMRRFVYPAGFDSAKHAIHNVDFLRRGLRVSSGDCSAFGKAGVSQTPKVWQPGLDSLKFGQPENPNFPFFRLSETRMQKSSLKIQSQTVSLQKRFALPPGAYGRKRRGGELRAV